MARRKILNALLSPLGFRAHRKQKNQGGSILNSVALERKTVVCPPIAEKLDYVVQRGPFEGLKLPDSGTWSDYDIVAKLIGAYEAELFPALEEIVGLQPDCAVNIGASEGYYAIGLKRRLPDCSVFTFDIDKNALPALNKCMTGNQVEISVSQHFNFESEKSDIDLSRFERPAFIVDCEGCEERIALMKPDEIQKSLFLVECHDMNVPNVTENLVAAMEETHDVEVIHQQVRDHRAFPELAHLVELDRFVVLSEFRGHDMHWIYAVPKAWK